MFHILYFTTPCCSKCKITGPNIRSAAAYYNLTLEEVNADDDKNHNLVIKYAVMEAPTIVLLQYGKEVWRTSGLKSVESLVQDLDEFINKE